MIVLFGRSCAILCLAWLAGVSRAEVKVENKAYQNVVVSFSPRINPDLGNTLLNSMTELLKETSLVLQEAIGLKIGSVIYNLPLSWDPNTLEGINPTPLSSKESTPDIRVEGITDSAFGQQPYALQYGGCGVPGIDITIPDGFLVSLPAKYPKGKILAREWLKYRYGVFDENGFGNDPKYPSHYTIDGSDVSQVTDCTFPKAHYHYKDSKNNNCSLKSDDCQIYPDEESEENVKSSLMFFHESLPNITHICGKDDNIHNVDSPNKHNNLCTYQSIWNVIESSEDFRLPQTSLQTTDGDENIQFSYVQESRIRVVLSWPNTLKLHMLDGTIQNLVRKFLYDLPLQSKYILHPFNAKKLDISDFIELKEDSDRGLARITSDFGEPDEGCISCAIDVAASQLLKDNANQKGIIFMIAVSDPEQDNALINKLQNSNICLVVAAFPGATTDGWNQLIETSTCNSIREIPVSEDGKDLFENLYKLMETILPLSLDDTRASTVVTNWLSADTEISVPANPMAHSFTLWIFADFPEHTITCKTENDEIVLNTVVESSEKLTSYSFLSQNKNVSCRCQYSSCKKSLTQVRMTSQKGAYFQADVWTYDTTPKNSEDQTQMPVIIYARLNYGQYPIQGAVVKAVIKGPNDQQQTIPLFDDGKGDPDITLHDGIYSRYFTQFVSKGEYTVEIIANDNGNNARYGKNGKEPCCGSIVQSESSELSPFQISVTTSFDAISGRPEKGYKPSRIVDLKADFSDVPNSITLKWTAPGGEADHGSASKYEFNVFCQYEDCDKDGTPPKWIKYDNEIKELKPKEYGNEENVTFHVSESGPQNGTVYFTVRAVNSGLQYGELSNRVYMEMAPMEQEITTIQKGRQPKSQTVGMIVCYAIISTAILIAIIGIIYFLSTRAKRGREFEELKTPQVISGARNTDNNVFSFKSASDNAFDNAMLRAESFPVLLYTHDQLRDLKNKTKDPPLYELNSPPKPWVSLNSLSSGANNLNKDGSERSSNTVLAEDTKANSNEMEQLEDISNTSEPSQRRTSQF